MKALRVGSRVKFKERITIGGVEIKEGVVHSLKPLLIDTDAGRARAKKTHIAEVLS
jgi:hypothetical protein